MIKGKNLKFFRHIATVLILILCAANTPLIVQPALATPIEDGDLLAGNWESTYWISTQADEDCNPSGAIGTFECDQSPDRLFDGVSTADYDGTLPPTKHFVAHQKMNLIFDFDPVRSPLGDSGVQVSGLQMATANDEPGRDPTAWSLYGTNTPSPTTSDFVLIADESGIVPPARNSDYQRTNFVAPSEKYRFFRFIVDEVAGEIVPGYLDSASGGSALSSLRLFSPQGPGEFEPLDSSNTPLMATKSCSKIESNPPSNGAGFFSKMQATDNITINEIALSMPLDVEAKFSGGEESFGGSVEIYMDENGIPAWQLPIAVFRTSSQPESLVSGQTVHYVSIDGGFSLASGAYFWVKTLDPTCNTNYPIFAESKVKYNASDSGISIERLNNDPAIFPVEELNFVNDIFAPAIALFGTTPSNVGFRIATTVGNADVQGYGTIDGSQTNAAAGSDIPISFSPDNGSRVSQIFLDGTLLPLDNSAYVDSTINFTNISRNHIVVVTFTSLHPCSASGNYFVDQNGVASDNPNPNQRCNGDLILDESVTSVAQYGFGGNEQITSVTFGSNVLNVSGAAFQSASNISSITLNEGLETIGGYAFNGLPNLVSVSIPDTVSIIGQGSFMSSPLTSLTLGTGLLEIGYSAFAAEQLTELVIPDSLTFLGSPFNGSQLTRLTVGGDGYNDEAPAFPNIDPSLLSCFTNRVQGQNRSTWMINTTLANIPWCGTWTLTYSAGANGGIEGVLSQIIDEDTDGQAVRAVPSRSDYQFVSWSDGVTDNPRTDLSVTANIAVTANFSPIPVVTHTLTLNVGANGTSDPNTSSTTIVDGRDQMYVFTPDTGFEIDYVMVDGEDFTGDIYFDPDYEDSMILDILNVVENHTISVTFISTTTIPGITPPVVNLAVINGYATLAGGETLTVSGYAFQAGATVTVAGSSCNVTARSSVFSVPNNRTEFHIECTMPAITTFGALSLVVTNDDGGQDTWTVFATADPSIAAQQAADAAAAQQAADAAAAQQAAAALATQQAAAALAAQQAADALAAQQVLDAKVLKREREIASINQKHQIALSGYLQIKKLATKASYDKWRTSIAKARQVFATSKSKARNTRELITATKVQTKAVAMATNLYLAETGSIKSAYLEKINAEEKKRSELIKNVDAAN